MKVKLSKLPQRKLECQKPESSEHLGREDRYGCGDGRWTGEFSALRPRAASRSWAQMLPEDPRVLEQEQMDSGGSPGHGGRRTRLSPSRLGASLMKPQKLRS